LLELLFTGGLDLGMCSSSKLRSLKQTTNLKLADTMHNVYLFLFSSSWRRWLEIESQKILLSRADFELITVNL
ncbi:hypothetical protein T4E_9652, partial [Trichinella pseudospiralis]